MVPEVRQNLPEQQATGRRRLSQRWSMRQISVRSRILMAVLGLAALGLVVAGYTAFAIQQIQVESRINAELQADSEQFRLLHDVGVDPRTGESFSSPADLVHIAMQRIIPTRNEGAVGFVDGEVAFTSAVAPVALEDDAELVEALRPYALSDRASFTTISTSRTTYRAAVVPVHAQTTAEDIDGQDHEVATFVLAYDLTAERGVFADGFIIYAIVAAFSLVVVAVVGWIVAGRVLHPVRVLAGAARRIGREDISERIPVAGGDDLAEMTRAVNEMLERLEGAFRAQDQLVADVSHELRTPLTILRGHLEVLDVGDPADIVATRELAIDELKRMNRVVDDLTTLAQAEHPEFVQPQPTDIGTLTDEVFDKAIALGPRRWTIAERTEAVAMLDRERITQAWLQLAANAVKFSPEGSVISLASQVQGDDLLLSLRDQGEGIAEEDQQRIFERFGRTDKSKPGSGLGLPIVAAIVRAHGGHVVVESQPGAGATFTMVIPAGIVEVSGSQEGPSEPDTEGEAPA
ncbi:sensor histidine kinase [Nesterenkonia rhizosphaerae]|uniref:Signal transduction histidine-protein kinase/phosphatase MprB n=1 Tax=Nesterenkonia rhizosphaerae TaxID=1348272 RepID=A0ABP9FPM7_9MICC